MVSPKSARLCKQTHASLSARNSSSRTGGGSEPSTAPPSPPKFRGRARCFLDSGPPCPPPPCRPHTPSEADGAGFWSPMPGTGQEHLQPRWGDLPAPRGCPTPPPSPRPSTLLLHWDPQYQLQPPGPNSPHGAPRLCPHALASQPTNFTSRGFDLHLRPQLGPMT